MNISRKLKREIEQIKTFQKMLVSKTDQDLAIVYAKGKTKRNFTFAITAEVIKRLYNIELYDEQLIGAIVMSEGYIAELKTGEGKTFVGLLVSVYQSAFHKVYNVTVNDYLAQRDYEKTLGVYQFLKINSAYNLPLREYQKSGKKSEDKIQLIQQNEVIYTSGSELIFDYLRESSFWETDPFPLDYVIIDEIDFVLIDNANSKFSVSKGKPISYSKKEIAYYQAAQRIFAGMNGGKVLHAMDGTVDEEAYPIDYLVSDYDQTCSLTEQGIQKIMSIFKTEKLESVFQLYKALLNTIMAYHFFTKDKDYLVQNNEIILINPHNGRLMFHSQKDDDLQLALDLKENVKRAAHKGESLSLSYQVFFSHFKNLTGMSGTAKDAEAEFSELFHHAVYVVPSHFPIQRKDHSPRFFKTSDEKLIYLLELTEQIQQQGRPLLIITGNERETDRLTEHFKNQGYSVQNLKADNVQEEAQIISQAGRSKTITIATNLVGRGTDIPLTQEVIQHGGLFICVFNRYESIRIEHQIQGRAGRQGQPGETLFLCSLEDDLFKYADLENYQIWSQYPDEKFYSSKTELFLNREIETIQKRLNLTWRKHRKLFFDIECLTEQFKDYLWREFQKKLSLSYLTKIIQRELDLIQDTLQTKDLLFTVSEPVFFLGKKITPDSDFSSNEKSLLGQLETKIQTIGKKTSIELLKKLYQYHFQKAWEDFKQKLEDLIITYRFTGLDDKTARAEYYLDCEKELHRFNRFLEIRCLEYFLTAIREKQGIKENQNSIA